MVLFGILISQLEDKLEFIQKNVLFHNTSTRTINISFKRHIGNKNFHIQRKLKFTEIER